MKTFMLCSREKLTLFIKRVSRITFIILLFLPLSFFAQENDSIPKKDTSYWNFGLQGNSTLTQSHYEFWSSGGQNAIAVSNLFNLFLNYEKGLSEWENNMDIAYGLSYQDFNDNVEKTSRKTDDRLEFTSKYGRKSGINSKIYYTVLASFKTQITRGFNYKEGQRSYVSNFFSPAYLNLSAGIDYKPNKKLSFYLAPVSSKTTFVLDDSLSAQGSFGVDPGKAYNPEIGGFFKGAYKDEVIKNVSLSTKLELFSNYMENPDALDVNWELLVIMKINEYLSANLNTVLVYDQDIDAVDPDDGIHNPRIQFKEIFGVGLSFKF